MTRNVIDDDWAFTELVEVEPEDEDTDAVLEAATSVVTVMESSASLLPTEYSPLRVTPGGGAWPPENPSLGPK